VGGRGSILQGDGACALGFNWRFISARGGRHGASVELPSSQALVKGPWWLADGFYFYFFSFCLKLIVCIFFSGKRRCQRSRAPLDTGILLKTLQELIQFYRQNAGNRKKNDIPKGP
jgi:hypothetical protein